jgi:MFS family permease
MTTSIGFWFNFGNATIILFLLKTLHLKEQYFGLAMSITGIGSVIASLSAAKVSQRFGRGKVMWFSMFIQCAIWIVQASLHSYVPFIALGILNALLGTYWNILIMSTYQELIPNHLYGRIHGTRRTLVWGMMPFGALLGGYVSTFGLRAPIFIGGAIAIVITIFNFGFISRLGNSARSQSA